MRGWRTLALNLATGLAVIAAEMAGFLAGVDWAAALGPREALWLVVAVNLANIALRHLTRGPAGWCGRKGKCDEQQAEGGR